ncbi:MAG: hypothetical protein V4526_02645 [Patescibacteria group bacterium]
MKKLLLTFAILACVVKTHAAIASIELLTPPPQTDQVWRGGEMVIISYTVTGCSGTTTIKLLPEDVTCPPEELPDIPIVQGGVSGTGWTLPLELNTGYYRLHVTGTNDAGVEVSATGPMIKIMSGMTSPSEGQIIKAGGMVRMTWNDPIMSSDHYTIYLVGDGAGPDGYARLGTVSTVLGKKVVKIPRTVATGKYKLFLHSYFAGSVNGDEFTVENKKIPAVAPSDKPKSKKLPFLSSKGSHNLLRMKS